MSGQLPLVNSPQYLNEARMIWGPQKKGNRTQNSPLTFVNKTLLGWNMSLTGTGSILYFCRDILNMWIKSEAISYPDRSLNHFTAYAMSKLSQVLRENYNISGEWWSLRGCADHVISRIICLPMAPLFISRVEISHPWLFC